MPPEPPEASPRFVVVTPCRDEAENLPATIASMAAQTLRPTTWIVVDDGSTDGTADVLAGARSQHDFIRVVTREDRGGRSVGPGVIEAFNAGLEAVDLGDYEFVCKLDADLELPPDYFRLVVDEMLADPMLGNFSGKVYTRFADGSLVCERMGDENAVGAAKFYRVACFRAIGGFVPQVCWDGIDGHRCRMLGWIAASRDDLRLRLVQRRPMGSSDKGLWTGRQRWGRGKYMMGSALYYVCVVSLVRAAERPFLLGGLGILVGYLKAMCARAPRYADGAFRRELRRFEGSSLLRGKRRTTRIWNDRIRAAGRATP